MRRATRSIVLGLVLGTLAFFPMFMASAGHDSTSVFVGLSRSMALRWPYLIADFALPASASTAVSNLGLAIHYGFYTFVGWLLSYFSRDRSRTAA